MNLNFQIVRLFEILRLYGFLAVVIGLKNSNFNTELVNRELVSNTLYASNNNCIKLLNKRISPFTKRTIDIIIKKNRTETHSALQ